MYFKSITFLLTLIVLINHVVGKNVTCIQMQQLYPISDPCLYSDGPDLCGIVCYGIEKIDIKAILSDLKHRLPVDVKPFGKFDLYNNGIEELPANALGGLQFNEIHLHKTNQLQRIHLWAFNGTAATVTKVTIEALRITEAVSNSSDLFGAIGTLTNLTYLQLYRTGVTTLPMNAISGQKNLRQIRFVFNPLTSIYAHAFNDLPALEYLYFDTSPIERVAEHAFTIGRNTTTQQMLWIYLGDQSTDPFTNRSLESIGCATTLRFYTILKGCIKYLAQNEFEVFLTDNTLNSILDDSIDCTDSRNQWIKEKYPHVWDDLKCT